VDKFERWRDYVAHHHLDAPGPDAAPWNLTSEEHIDSYCGREAARRIYGYHGDSPLYLQVNFPGPHPPFDPTSEFLAALDPQDPRLPLPILAESRGPVSPAGQKYRSRRQRAWTEERCRWLRTLYFAKVSLVDRAVGEVLDALTETGLDGEAWIVLASDHGELLADHHLSGKVLCYESALRVPLLIRPPKGARPWVDHGIVDLLDVVATIRAIAGLESDGSLLPRVLEGPAGTSAHANKAVVFENMGYVGIRIGDLTCTWDRRARRPVELFDRARDPQELCNVVEEPEYRQAVSESLSALRDCGAI
jgi:arylsulfatase A-like enzyme